MSEKKTDCPCKNVKCARHGLCEECRDFHRKSGKSKTTACERAEQSHKA